MKINTNTKNISIADYGSYAQMFQKSNFSGVINGSFIMTQSDYSFYAGRCTFQITYNDETSQNYSPDYNLYSDVTIVIYNLNKGTLELYNDLLELRQQITNIKTISVKAESTTGNKWLCFEVTNV